MPMQYEYKKYNLKCGWMIGGFISPPKTLDAEKSVVLSFSTQGMSHRYQITGRLGNIVNYLIDNWEFKVHLGPNEASSNNPSFCFALFKPSGGVYGAAKEAMANALGGFIGGSLAVGITLKGIYDGALKESFQRKGGIDSHHDTIQIYPQAVSRNAMTVTKKNLPEKVKCPLMTENVCLEFSTDEIPGANIKCIRIYDDVVTFGEAVSYLVGKK